MTPHDEHDDWTFLTRAARDTFTVSRVFGEAYERDGVLVIPVARVLGGTGSGSGRAALRRGHVPGTDGGETGSDGGTSAGGGGGFGTSVTPIGIVVVDDAGVHWRPAIDVNRAIRGGQVVGAIAVVTLGWVLGRRRRRR